jgi:AraC-like DNA-binding protein
MLNISTRTLSRQLKECGTSYNKLLRQVQLERAMKYLNDTGMSVAKIADHLGYSEPGAFTRAFQRWVGASPLAWRNSQGKHR